MKRKNLINLILIVSSLLLVGPGVVAAGGSKIKHLVIFGDSLSDAGNAYAYGSGLSAPPYAVIPSAPYGLPGYQFSNGKTWAQNLARHMHLRSAGKATELKDRPRHRGNYAFGGARARLTSGLRVPSGQEQLDLYFADTQRKSPKKTLFVIQLGGNDARDGLELLQSNPTDIDGLKVIIGSAIQAKAAMILQLYQSGARQFLVANVPNLALAPAVSMGGEAAIGAALLVVGSYNAALEQTLQGLEAAMPDVSIKRLDFYGLLSDFSENPKKYGFRNTESACLTFGVVKDAICRKPKHYIFWDGIHPTKKVHKLVGRAAAKIVKRKHKK